MKKIVNKQPIAIFVTDIHLDKDNGELVKSIFNQLIELCKKYEVNRIICGGDVFTNRSGQPLSCLKDFREILRQLTKEGIELHVIPGNHDKTDGNAEDSYLDVYGDKSLKLYSSAAFRYLDGVIFVFIPYFGDDVWLQEFERVDALVESSFIEKDFDEETPVIMITHSGFDGVVNNDGSAVSSLIKPKMFENYSKVLIGHYHNASKLAKNVIYTGSAYQNNYGENITDKGFTLIYDDASIEFVPSKFPKYIKEVLDINDQESLRNVIEKYQGEKYDHIRLLFRGKKEDAQKVNITELSRLGFDCKFEAEETTEAIEISESEAVLSYDKKTLTKDFLTFCKEQKIKGNKLKYGLDLIKNISNVASDKN
jgi:DNA repair exonuclease SbcCD nuclease subunit